MDLQSARALEASGNLLEAMKAYLELLNSDPVAGVVIQAIGTLLPRDEDPEGIFSALESAIETHKNDVVLQSSYAKALSVSGREAEASAMLKKIVALRPDSSSAHDDYGVSLERLSRGDDARESFQRAVALDPTYFQAVFHLGSNLRKAGKLAEAVKVLQQAGSLRPDDVGVVRKLSAIAAERGDLRELIRLNALILSKASANALDYSALLASLHYDPEVSPVLFLQAAKAWADLYAEPLTRAAKAPERDREPERRLRIGYVAYSLKEHPEGRLVAPILAGHDRSQFETFCYCDLPQNNADDLTAHLKGLADHWRSIHRMPDGEVFNLIFGDQIDILIELCGHFGQHRLTLLARRPAPIQMSAFGYCDTTGMTAINYRITDARSDPPGESDRFYTENLLRISDCCWCYDPWDESPKVRPPACVRSGTVTFGNLNNAVKTSDAVVKVWADILHAVSGSKLVLLTPHGAELDVVRRFGRFGISGDRLLQTGPVPRRVYLELFRLIDIALDPFPFNGDNTTCDAIWMGVPVVALEGDRFWSRRGLSHLSAVGLPELVASSKEMYVRIACDLANSPARLIKLRRELRPRLIQSPLGDRAAYVAKLEAAYRRVWREWCKRAPE